MEFIFAFFDAVIDWRAIFLFFNVSLGGGSPPLHLILYDEMALAFPFDSFGATSEEALHKYPSLPFSCFGASLGFD